MSLEFHWYGFIVGLAVVAMWLMMTTLVGKRYSAEVEKVLVVVFPMALFGARVWHVVTDWQLYAEYSGVLFLWHVLAVWQGGLSILGAIAGGMIGLFVAQWWWKIPTHRSLLLLDCAAIALPISQAIGRVSNYLNQELYGFPTQLPWAIYIDPEHRGAQFMAEAWFHPLFAYEAVATAGFGCGVFLYWQRKNWQVTSLPGSPQQRLPWGAGRWFWLYLMYYSVVRFGLEFWRVDKVRAATIGEVVFSINQVILLSAIVILLTYLSYWVYEKK